MTSVSVIVGCRNEEHHIEACVRSILGQEEPHGNFEIIVLDGMSEDGTRDIVVRIALGDSRVRLIDNPFRIKPCGINVGIQCARGRYIAILDAHTVYASDYLRACVELLEEHPEASCAGGPIVSQGRGPFGRAVAAAMSHPVGVGNAKHRLPNYEGYAEGACHPMFRREVFEKVGLYDENLIRNHDDEFNYRLALSGVKVFISPRARCTYFVRETPSQLFRQYFQYGFWRVAVLRKHRLPAAVRQIIPPGFVLLMLSFLALGLWLPGWWLTAIVLPVAYGSMLGWVATGVARRHGWLVGLLFPVAAAIIHVAYAAGFTWGILKGRNRMVNELPYSKGEFHAPRP